MAVIINTNVDSIKIRHNLTTATNIMSRSMERMSTGLKVLSSKDDAAGNVIAARMKVQLDGNLIAQQNVQSGNAMLATAEGNLDVVIENVSRIRDLTLQAKNSTSSIEEIQAMQGEVAERIAEINRISLSSTFSALHLFEELDEDGKTKESKGGDGSLQGDGAIFQVGANPSEDNTILVDKKLFGSVNFSTLLGLKDGKKEFDLTKMKGTQEKDGFTFETALESLDKALDDLTSRKSLIGSAQNRLDSALDTLTTQYENLSSAKSLITDADIAAEATDFTQNSILQQVSTSLLAQANQAPAIALSLV